MIMLYSVIICYISHTSVNINKDDPLLLMYAGVHGQVYTCSSCVLIMLQLCCASCGVVYNF